MAYSENIDRIHCVIEYIEDNINKDITLDDISCAAALSKFHLHRIFKALTNKSLMDYVRGRKLACSANQLLNTEFNIIDIAYEYGFSQEQNYIRAFTKTFNISPAKFRKERTELLITNKIDINYLHPVEEGILIEPYFIIKPKFYTIGISREVTNKENMKNFIAAKLALKFFYEEKYRVENRKNDHVYIGLIKYNQINVKSPYYIPSCEVTSLKHIPEGMEGHKIPSNQYAVFRYIGFHKQDDLNIKLIDALYSSIFGEWLPKSSYSQAADYHFEVVDSTISREDYCEMIIYVPVKCYS